jgi:hypothetical protein
VDKEKKEIDGGLRKEKRQSRNKNWRKIWDREEGNFWWVKKWEKGKWKRIMTHEENHKVQEENHIWKDKKKK